MASTAVNASTTGMLAATSAPKATTRTSSVIGTESCSARRRSAPTVASSSRFALAAPNSSIT